MLDGAKEYLARVVHWPQGADAEGYINVHWSAKNSDPTKKKYWDGRATSSVTDAARVVEWALGLDNTLDIYVCMSTQRDYQTKTSQRNHTYKKAVRSTEGAVYLRSFFLDIDIREPVLDPVSGKLVQKGYKDIGSALDALIDFVGKVGLPPPTLLVGTGGGIHVYWIVNRALTVSEWQPYAHALSNATQQHGLQCDTQCTVDAARILRIPDTFNRKEEAQRAVRLLSPPRDFDYNFDRIAGPLEPFKTFVAAARTGAFDPVLFPRRAPVTVANELAAGVDALSRLVHLDSVLPACGFLRDAVANGGATYSNPLWNLTTLAATFTEDGLFNAHRMAFRHVDYSQVTTTELYERKQAEKESRGLGWPSCRAIAGAGCGACKSCPNALAGKSPLNFEAPRTVVAAGASTGIATPAQNQNAAATTTHFVGAAGAGGAVPPAGAPPAAGGNAAGPKPNWDLPDGYSRDTRGIVSLVMINDDGTQRLEPVSTFPMTHPRLMGNPFALRFMSNVAMQPVEIDLPTMIVSTPEMRKHLQEQCFMIPQDPKRISSFMSSWIEKLQATQNAVTTKPFGWIDKDGKMDGFAYAGKHFTGNMVYPASAAVPATASQYTPKGDAQKWADALPLVFGRGRADLETIVATAFAAPLVKLLGNAGITLCAFSSESGIGKSSALKIAQAVWGDCKRGVQSLDDTPNSVARKIGELRSLPVYWDEIKGDMQTQKFVSIAFQVAIGKEKSRLNSRAQHAEMGDWSTMLVACSNDSILSKVNLKTSTAGMHRVFEFRCVKPHVASNYTTSDAQVILSELESNYGHIGMRYAQFLGENQDMVKKAVVAYSNKVAVELGATSDERNWVAAMAAIYQGANLATTLGYVSFDLPALETFLKYVFMQLRNEVTGHGADMSVAEDVSNIFAQFLKSMFRDRTLFTDHISLGSGRPSGTGIKVLNAHPDRLTDIAVQVGQVDKMLKISSDALGRWCHANEVSRALLTSGLKEKFGMTRQKSKLGAGTAFAGALEQVLIIDTTGHSELDVNVP